ncbi:hypothetical protein WICANDRAFT_31084 [Wickerhamomyces anomalus NRRL Y-366-8]|uniref:JmjC domain-containing protein n=1 Tax=Wickerhamomyces anomalus (strain ATCC 58044 / CBS 1984 / NCYC 433 / NRRL Y-366-8) TaxID=683960 RepID=A0A1E3P2S6_WICAA|nr:uncharacterized protein WICANDRAFT_31084 [Wickerhamomyces anomalus NRRL Y-366-8]ODQ59705.1 hypothetical protein WICANDRAFT_31084 [Wickerhamomyces anomalus NRRL Y-366-8]
MTINEDSGSRNKRRNISRGISRDVVTQRHPLNVKPSGNALIFQDSKLSKTEDSLLGDFRIFNDELILDILGFIDDPNDLKNLSHCSRIFYAFIYDEELWRRLYMRKSLKELTSDQENLYPLGIEKWEGSWRRTMLRINESQEANIKLADNLLCSDVLFRPYQCSQIDYKTLFKDLIAEEEQSWKLQKTQNVKFGIERIDEDELTSNLFNSDYYNKPFILTSKDETRWPQWDLDQLVGRFPLVKFRQESVQWPLIFYSKYFQQNKDESPLYLFDCQSSAIQKLTKEYKVPSIFQTDYFKLFNTVTCRPDHRWLIVGPQRSGSTFHKDPNFTSAWNANLCGMKLWIMLPPDIKPPGVGTDEEESEVTSPVGIAEWILSGFYNDSVKLAMEGKCQIGITFPGECMFVPSGWWHSVINLEDSVALTQNFVPIGYLPNVLNFLKNKKNQISGFHVKDFTKSLKNFIDANKIENQSFNKFLKEVEEKEINNEDIGECSNHIDLPIFEFFIELIKQDPDYNKTILEDALNKLKTLENEDAKKHELERKIIQSKIWDELTKKTTTTEQFSFNFESDEDDN